MSAGPAYRDGRDEGASALRAIWRIVGAPATTLVLVSTYWLAMGLKDYAEVPTRHWYEVVVMVPLISIVGFITVSTAQILAYIVMTVCTVLLVRWTGGVQLWALLLLTPLLGLLTWYGYDRFVPDYRFYADVSAPYEHGLTFGRFMKAWGFEILVVLGYWWPMRTRRITVKKAP